MTLRTLPFLITASIYLLVGIWVALYYSKKAQRLYGAMCIFTSLWQAIWIVLLSNLPPEMKAIGVKLCYTGIVFIPPFFERFIQEFSMPDFARPHALRVYGISVLFAASLWTTPWLVDGFYHNSWGMAPKGGWLVTAFFLFIVYHLSRIVILLRTMLIDPATSEIKIRQAKFAMAATIIYSVGAVDLITQYGVPLFPFSFFFTGVALVLFGYAIFRYEFLAIAISRETEEDRVRREAASNEMKQMGMMAAFPLVSQGELLGYLLLGEKMSEESYSNEDLLLLRIVANQAALAYQRVRYLEMAVHGARTEMLGEIAGGFAHEIKTPLANISLPAELSMMDLNDLEEGKKKLEDILPELKARMADIMQQAFKASEKIEAIRQFSKPGAIQLEAVDLARILQSSLGLLDHLLKKTNTRVRTEFPAIMSPIRGDAKQLEIVFVNLIKNAAEAMALHSSAGLARELWLKGHEDSNWVVTSIRDSGPGIRRTDFGHIFEAYFTTKGHEGTGMGLFLSRQVIKAHGGSIDVNSEEGKGTEFVIRLPKYMGQEQGNVHKAA